jgi:hypothetical protein
MWEGRWERSSRVVWRNHLSDDERRAPRKVHTLPATGAVDAATFLELWEAWSLVVPPVTQFPPLYVFFDRWEEGYVSTYGTWQRPEVCPALFPAEQTTTIACYRQRGICIAGTAAIRPLGENVRLDVAPDFWNIESWDEHEIRATRGAVPPCGDKESLHIERASRTVTKQRLQGDGQTPGEFQSLSSTLLVDGKEVTKRQETQRRERLLDLAKRFGAIGTPTMLPRE